MNGWETVPCGVSQRKRNFLSDRRWSRHHAEHEAALAGPVPHAGWVRPGRARTCGKQAYIPHCTRRFRSEHGAEPPRTVDWDDPLWRSFQKARQAWLLEFAKAATSQVKRIRPFTVNHQFSTIYHPWTVGVPFEVHTSRTRIYTDHVTVKQMEEIRVESFVSTLHSAGLLLVDYINADGTLNPEVYAFLAGLNEQRAAYEPYLGGELLADVAIYYDKNKVHVSKLQAVDKCPHRDAVLGAARLDRFDASGPRFLLERVFAVRYAGAQGNLITYLTPRDEAVRTSAWPQDHLSYSGPMVRAEALAGAEVLATVTLPFVEMTLLPQAEKRRLLVGLFSMQQQLLPLAVAAIVRVQAPAGRRVCGFSCCRSAGS